MAINPGGPATSVAANPTPRAAVQRMAPYHPPTGGRMDRLRLDFNENTLGCSEKVTQFIAEHLVENDLAVYPEYGKAVEELAQFFKVSPEMPFSKLAPRIRGYLMDGIPEELEEELGVQFEGVMPNLKRRYEETESEFVKERLLAYMSSAPCPACAGKRLRPAALAVKVTDAVVAVPPEV